MLPEMITGHELIHFWREITKRHSSGVAIHWIFIEGKILSDFKSESERKGDVEEYRTVGIGNSTKENVKNIGVYGDYNKAEDITENSLRKEHGLPLRMRYIGNAPNK